MKAEVEVKQVTCRFPKGIRHRFGRVPDSEDACLYVSQSGGEGQSMFLGERSLSLCALSCVAAASPFYESHCSCRMAGMVGTIQSPMMLHRSRWEPVFTVAYSREGQGRGVNRTIDRLLGDV